MCRVLVAHMIKTRILQHCKKIKHVSVLHLVLIRFFCFAPLPMLHRCRCVVLIIVSRSVTPNFSHCGNIALFRLGLSALCILSSNAELD